MTEQEKPGTDENQKNELTPEKFKELIENTKTRLRTLGKLADDLENRLGEKSKLSDDEKKHLIVFSNTITDLISVAIKFNNKEI